MEYLSNLTIQNTSKRVEKTLLKKLFALNDVILNWEKISSVIGKREKNKNRAYTLEEIRQMLNHAPDLRSKVVILLLASTGIRIEALATLTIGNLRAMEHKGYKFYAITIYEGEPEEYVTFCTPECAKAIDDYMDFRLRIKEPHQVRKQKIDGKQVIIKELKPSAPLIRDEVDIETALANPDKRTAKRVTKDGLDHILREIVQSSGVREALSKTIDDGKKVRYEAHLSRGFRKFFYTRLVDAKVEPIHREYLHGHLDGSQNLDSTNLMMVYTTPEDTDLFKSYLKAVDLLTINEESRLKRQLEQKQKLDEETLKQTVAQMIEQYLARRQQLAQAYPSMSPEQFAEQIEQIEKLNPLDRLLSHDQKSKLGLSS